MRLGLIGYPLEHSFSKAFFSKKFVAEGLTGFSYENFPVSTIDQVWEILSSDVVGLNVTIPYKVAIMALLDKVDEGAQKIGAVNTLVRTEHNLWKGFNTDAPAFLETLKEWYQPYPLPAAAIVLGTGGASKAVCYVLRQAGVPLTLVSSSGKGDMGYVDLDEKIFQTHPLIINTTPLGMVPHETTCPQIPYGFLNEHHRLYDLVYNPANTLFLSLGAEQGAKTKNGLDMLHRQAELAWAIWKKYGKF